MDVLAEHSALFHDQQRLVDRVGAKQLTDEEAVHPFGEGATFRGRHLARELLVDLMGARAKS